MNYPSIRIEGAILSPDILSRIEDHPGQRPSDFALESGVKVKDEIARAWADAQDYWRIFQRKLESLKPGSNATTETRNLWIIPLLALLRYEVEYQPRGTELNGRIYPISHQITNRARTSLQIIGYLDPAGLDKKPTNAQRRMSAHALVQEFLNLKEELYGLVTDGRVIRLLRNSSRLVNQTFLEFDLERIFMDGLYADFAILFRLLHATRLPLTNESATQSFIEQYHQDSLESGERIREGLSKAVENALLNFGNGFLAHPQNEELRAAVSQGSLTSEDYYKCLLRLIYRLLFLMVIEERDLVFSPDTPKTKRNIYERYYSVQRLRRLSEKRHLADHSHNDLWIALLANFSLFEADGPGKKLFISPLAGDLFHKESIGPLVKCTIGNDVLLDCIRSLSLYHNPANHQLIRINYAGLNVEEFGSVYEGLLEYDPELIKNGKHIIFSFKKGDLRATTCSHYTHEDLVQPLIKHSLDHLINDSLKADIPEKALLNLRVADIACGSGHILLAAARRIGTELAIVRTREEQPSPLAYRAALRDVIRNCIYGVDLNPLAVELCKVALWLEAHSPGLPLNFLDHHIKCGNAIVGYTHREELSKGIPNEAFKALAEDDKEVAAALRKRNRLDRKDTETSEMKLTPEICTLLEAILEEWHSLSSLPEESPAQIEKKKAFFTEFFGGETTGLLKQIAAIPIAQFFIPKTKTNESKLITDAEYRRYWWCEETPKDGAPKEAWKVSHENRIFHWFLEFPEIMEKGGFDCILGNPPYLGGQALSGTYGHRFCEYVKWQYSPTGLSELAAFFLRRIHSLIKQGGFAAIITTNSITDGDIRKDGLEQVVKTGSQINMAVRAVKWPGKANLVVSMMSLHKGMWIGPRMLDGKPVPMINTFFEENDELGEPTKLPDNRNHVFQGSIFLGDGFLLTNDEADQLCDSNPRNSDVIMPVINGQELNNEPDQKPGRSIINFRDWPIKRAQKYPVLYERVLKLVKPIRDKDKMRSRREKWWQFGSLASSLYDGISNLPHCFVAAATTKYLNFSAAPTNRIFANTIYVFTTDRWDLFSVVQSTIHEVWARKYSGSLKQDLRYSPSKCFETFPFPSAIWQNPYSGLAEIGAKYHKHRKALMESLWLGLTKIYNLFHAKDLSPEMVARVSKKDSDTACRCYMDLLELRRLQAVLDNAVRDAYGWNDLDLEHGFHEVETLPLNDRVRYTISSSARREILNRLLKANQENVVAETSILNFSPKKARKKTTKCEDTLDFMNLLLEEA